MAVAETTQRARDLLLQLRRAAAAHDEAVAEARGRFELTMTSVVQAEANAQSQARDARYEAEQAAIERHKAENLAAHDALTEARRRASGYAQSIRSYWSGADTALGLANLRAMQEVAQNQVTAIGKVPPTAQPERELVRCVGEAGKASKRIDAGVQQEMAERAGTRKVYPRLALAAAVAIVSAGLLLHEAARPCSLVRTTIGIHAGCKSVSPPTQPPQKHALAPGLPEADAALAVALR